MSKSRRRRNSETRAYWLHVADYRNAMQTSYDNQLSRLQLRADTNRCIHSVVQVLTIIQEEPNGAISEGTVRNVMTQVHGYIHGADIESLLFPDGNVGPGIPHKAIEDAIRRLYDALVQVEDDIDRHKDLVDAYDNLEDCLSQLSECTDNVLFAETLWNGTMDRGSLLSLLPPDTIHILSEYVRGSPRERYVPERYLYDPRQGWFRVIIPYDHPLCGIGLLETQVDVPEHRSSTLVRSENMVPPGWIVCNAFPGKNRIVVVTGESAQDATKYGY